MGGGGALLDVERWRGGVRRGGRVEGGSEDLEAWRGGGVEGWGVKCREVEGWRWGRWRGGGGMRGARRGRGEGGFGGWRVGGWRDRGGRVGGVGGGVEGSACGLQATAFPLHCFR